MTQYFLDSISLFPSRMLPAPPTLSIDNILFPFRTNRKLESAKSFEEEDIKMNF
jgi:hypothetical protein